MSESKITSEHKQRLAYVYVRQSTMQQTRKRVQGKERQYELAHRAEQLGFVKVVVIDDDLGRSGAGVEDRPGFGRLLAAVCEGSVGAVFALEASRLARNNRDWHHLIDLCALTSTLVIDHDGIYDPRQINDRLLLGLKGSMAEFELGLLRQRARESIERVVAQGDVVTEVPIGYVRIERRMEFTPDRQVQEAIKSVFAKFKTLGSARQVALWFIQEALKLPYLKRGQDGLEEAWRNATCQQVQRMLKNPAYAGAFAYGKTTSRQKMIDGRPRKTRGHRLALSQWRVLIHDHHDAYITWSEFLKNQEVLAANATLVSGSGAPKNGAALLSSLIRCRRCGRIMQVGYSGNGGRILRYVCQSKDRELDGFKCLSFAGSKVDRAVTEAMLEALQPAGIEAALQAWESICQDANDKRKALELSLRKAQYEVERARRQYDKVDPENRLVASELERRWNAALQDVAELQHRLEQTVGEEFAYDERTRERLLELGNDLEATWTHPAAPMTLKKRIIRSVVREIVADTASDPPRVLLWIHWAGGAHTPLQIRKNATGQHRRSTDRDIVELIRELAKVCQDKDIAAILNRLGYRTGTGRTWIASRVCSLRNHHKIPRMPSDREWVTLKEAAQTLRISESSMRRLIKNDILPAKQVVSYAPWIIKGRDLDRKKVKEAADAMRSARRAPLGSDNQAELPFKQET